MAGPLRVLERYEVLRPLASGGMGDVFLARQVGKAGFDRRVVLKTIRPELGDRLRSAAAFLAEARHVAKLNHPNVVSVLEVGEDRGILVLAMELVEGVDLRWLRHRVHAAGQRIPFRVAACMVRDAALGLAHAHDANPAVVHLDVSGANLMVRGDGLTKVLDFGLAAQLTELGRDPSQPLIGKVRYVAPEQLLRGAVDGRTDQYALGRVLWSLLTGREPFEGVAKAQIPERILAGAEGHVGVVVPDLPPELAALCDRMVALAPEQRFESCHRVAAALEPHAGPGGHEVVARFVRAVAGARLAELRADVAPQPVVIPGMRQAAAATCPRCGYGNPVRNLYCGACGARLGEIEAPPAAAPTATAPPLDLGAAAAALHAALVTAHPVHGVVAARWSPAEVAPPELSLRVVREGPGRGVWLAPADPGEAPGAAALRGGAALQADLPSEASVAVAVGPCAVPPGGAPPTGAPVEAALALAEAAFDGRGWGLHLPESMQDFLPEAARIAPAVFSGFGRALTWTAPAEASRADEGPLLGRTEIKLAIDARLAAARRGSGGVLVLWGAAGAGKTRLLRAAEVEARRRGFAVYALGEGGAGLEVALALQILGLGAAEHGAVRAAVLRLGLGGALADDLAPALPASVSAAARRAAALAVLWASARRQPALILVDDLSWRAPEVASLLAALQRGAAHLPVAAVVTADSPPPDAVDDRRGRSGRASEDERVEDEGGEPGLAGGGLDGRGLGAAGVEALALGPLPDDAVLAVAEGVLGGPLAAPAAQACLTAAQGMPGWARLWAAHLRGAGLLVRAPDAPRPWGLVVPATELALADPAGLVEQRLERLDPAARAALRAGAVVGPSFDLAHVAAALELEVDPAALEASGLVRAAPGAGQRFAFAPSSVQAVLRAAIPPDAAASLAARLYMAAGPDEDPVARAHYAVAFGAPALAVSALLRATPHLGSAAGAQLVRAGLPLMARWLEVREAEGDLDAKVAAELHAFVVAATDALAAETPAEAEAVLGLVVATVPEPLDPAGRRAALVARAEVRLARSQVQDALRDLDAADALAPGATWRGRLARARALEQAGDAAGAAGVVAAALAEGAPRGTEVATAALLLGRLELRRGAVAQARALFEQALSASAPDSASARRARLNLAVVSAREGALEAAARQLEGLEAEAVAGGELLEASRAAYNLGRVRAAQGASARAAEALERAAERAADVGWAEGLAAARWAQAGGLKPGGSG
ncbi:MAG: protein kinase [Deltaproteobacteria bacterium]|nr:protein kinase [Deltaproteobacteria bacterium]